MNPDARPFPGLVQAVGLLLLLAAVGLGLVVAWVAATGGALVPEDGGVALGVRAALVVNTVSFLVVLAVGWRASGRPLPEVFPVRRLSPSLAVAVSVAVAGLIPVMLGLLQLVLRLPGLGALEEVFREFGDRVLSMLREDPVAATVLLVAVAPVTEELFFRGLLLSGFRARYGPGRAVAASALLFSVAHLSPAQLPATVVLGLFLGWLYLRTRNLTACILAHALNNGVAATVAFFPAEEAAAPAAQAPVPVALLAGGALLLLVGAAWIRRLCAGTPAPVVPPPHL